MRTLVIETATAACSVALLDDDRVLAADHVVVGRGHAERLLPMIAALPDGGRAEAIIVDCGPGSFTGIRVGLAAGRALGLGWNARVTGYVSLVLIAAATFAADARLTELTVAIEGGHGELFVQNFMRSLEPADPLVSLPPAEALERAGSRTITGNALRWLQPIAPDRQFVTALPRASDVSLLPATLVNLDPAPVYGRAPDAKPMAAA